MRGVERGPGRQPARSDSVTGEAIRAITTLRQAALTGIKTEHALVELGKQVGNTVPIVRILQPGEPNRLPPDRRSA